MSRAVIDGDQHLIETRELWRSHIDPAARDDALVIERDDLGYDRLRWRGRYLALADLRRPGDIDAIGRLPGPSP